MWNSERIIWTVFWTEKSIEGRWPYYSRAFSNQREAKGFAKFLATQSTTLTITITSTEKWRKEK